MLTPLQQRVAAIIADLEEASDFALAGGAALIVQGTITRVTRDLDFFGLSPDAVDRLLPKVEGALREAGFDVERIRVHHGFARLDIRADEETTELDLAADARLLPSVRTQPAPTISGAELGADKVLAVVSRAEARDFGDLLMLESQYGLDRLLRLAAEKDLGFSLTVFVEMLERFSRLRRDEFDLSDLDHGRLVVAVPRWKERALALSVEKGKDQSRDPGRGVDM